MVVFRLVSPVPKVGVLRAKLSSPQALTHGSHDTVYRANRHSLTNVKCAT